MRTITTEMLNWLILFSEQIDNQMPVHQGLVFLAVADAGDKGIDMNDIGALVGLSTSAVSRNVAALGEWHRMQKPGLGLVFTETDLRDRRRKSVHLTPKGRRAITALSSSYKDGNS